ncbi:MAG: S8 family serine peptidase [Candidatus Eisenbacteria bacterium]|nr:S8 family serine peptidase [Candidatus Eisenbacteria bacterium]
MLRWPLRVLSAALVLLTVAAAAWAQAPGKLDARARVSLARARSADPATRQQTDAAALTLSGELDVFITGSVSRAQLEALGVTVRTELPGLFTAFVPQASLEAVEMLSSVTSIQGAAPVELNNNTGTAATGAPALRGPGPNFTGLNGAGVLVADVDTGVDYNHGDFLDPLGNTRFVSVWDQTVAGGAPAGYPYGTEWLPAQLNANTATEVDVNGHGTHVLGTIAGDGSQTGGAIPAFTYTGMAPAADLIMVKTDLTTTHILDGVAYVFGKATALGKNAVVNLSLGSQYGPHDGTSAFESGLTALTGPGRIICVSAGNDGGSSKHAEAFAAGTGTNITMTAGGSGTNRIIGIDGYYNGTENLSLQITTPNGTVLGPYTMGTINGSYPTGASTANGRVYVENGASVTSTGAREVYIEISPTTGQNFNGTWTFRFIPVTLGAANGEVDLWRFYTSTTAITANFVTGNQVNEEIISEPGNATGVITTGAYATKVNWLDCTGASIQFSSPPAIGGLAGFSSRGPTRDGRQKPDIVASGWAVGSTRSFDQAIVCSTPSVTLDDGINHIINSGTSMASPHTAGAAALLLQKFGAVTPAFVRSYLQTHAVVDGQTGAVPNKDYGYGKLFLGDLSNPVVTVTSPNGGESYQAGQSYNVTWTATDNSGVTSVDLYESHDGGVNWTTIAIGIANTGSYAWVGTTPYSTTCRTRVVAHDANGNAGDDISDADWIVFDSATPTLLTMLAAESVDDGIAVTWTLSSALSGATVVLERSDSELGEYVAVDAAQQAQSEAVRALDATAEAGRAYWYRLIVTRGTQTYTFGPISAQSSVAVTEFALGRVTPTPTRGVARFDYALPRAASVRLSVVDVMGREVARLMDGVQNAGRYQAVWNGMSERGPVSSGMYFVRLQTGGRTLSSRIVLSR